MRLLVSLPVVLGCLLAAPATSAPLSTDWGAAFYSGSERVLLYALTRDRPEGSLPFAAQLAHRLALDHEGGTEVLDRELSLAPILRYDENINGGTPNESFYLGPFELFVPEDSVAKAGMVVGGRLGAGTDIAFARQSRARFDLDTSLAYAPEYDVSRSQLMLSACSETYLQKWTWSEACLRKQWQRQELGESERLTASAGLIGVFPSALGVHEARLNLEYIKTGTYEKPALSARLTTAQANVGGWFVAAEISPQVEEINSTVLDIDAGYTRPVLDQPTSLRFGYTRQEGDTFFGEERRDEIYSVDLRRRLTDRLSVSVGASRRESTVSFYEETSYRLSVDVDAFDF